MKLDKVECHNIWLFAATDTQYYALVGIGDRLFLSVLCNMRVASLDWNGLGWFLYTVEPLITHTLRWTNCGQVQTKRCGLGWYFHATALLWGFHFIFPGSLSIHGGNHENSQHRSLSDQALDHGLVLALIPIPEDRVLKGSNAGGNSYLCVTKPWRHINRDYKIIVELWLC